MDSPSIAHAYCVRSGENGKRCSAVGPRRSSVTRTGRNSEQGRPSGARRFVERHRELADHASAASQRGTGTRDCRSRQDRKLVSLGQSRRNTDALRRSTHPSESSRTDNGVRLLLRNCVRCCSGSGRSVRPTEISVRVADRFWKVRLGGNCQLRAKGPAIPRELRCPWLSESSTVG